MAGTSTARPQRIDFDKIKNLEKRKVAEIVKEIIDASGKTQKEFARDAGIGTATITNIFSPSYNKLPSDRVLHFIAKQSSDYSFYFEELIHAKGESDTIPIFLDDEDSSLELFTNGAIERNQYTNFLVQNLQKQSSGACYPEFADITELGLTQAFPLTFVFKNEGKLWKVMYYTPTMLKKFRFNSVIDDFIWRVLTDGAKSNTKYSLFIADAKDTSPLTTLDLPTLLTTISILSIDNHDIQTGNLIEEYINTGTNKNDFENLTIK